MKIKVELLIEVEPEIWGLDNAEDTQWFLDDVLNPNLLYLHSNEIGDQVGNVLSAKCTLLEAISATISPNGVQDKGTMDYSAENKGDGK